MAEAQPLGDDKGLERGPHFTGASDTEQAPAWEQVDVGRYMPRRIRGSYKGRALG